ncbi:MAG TPA: hypothetical protein VF742_07820, partial [Terracidiphilus sp.]
MLYGQFALARRAHFLLDDVTGSIAVASLGALAPELLRRRPEIAQSIAIVQAAVAAGRGNDKATFDDIDLGKIFSVSTTPAIYLSFFGPESPAVMPENAARLTAPLLMVSGEDDPT